jgi:hypothetical protein
VKNVKTIISKSVVLLCVFAAAGCTVKAVGDPNRPITINAHITIDVKGLKDTAVNIEDFVSGKAEELPIKGEKR